MSHVELEGEIEHGMSGGPCFDKDWNVIGVNSSAWDGLPSAKVALLWPAMRVEIDLFKTGPFPAIDLFKSGDTSALGYRRVYVTSKREARFAHVDPDSLVSTAFFGMTEHLSGAIEFAASGAQEALAELRASLTQVQNGSERLNSNKVIRLVRHYFWELENALRLAILLAARQGKISVPEPPSGDQLIQALKAQTPAGDVLDEIATLAELSRSGSLGLEYMAKFDNPKEIGQILAISLGMPCRKGGQQLFLPDGLDRFMDAGRRFVQRLLRLTGAPK
jgi:hypothetical protein